MGLFGKKNKDQKGESGENKKDKKVSMNRKGKGHALTISVPESATELMQDNKPFIVNGQTVGAATSISSAIGDLSNKKDASIGQIVNYINHGTISAIVLDQLLNDDTIIIIPDSATIETMRAYDSFKNAEYELCYVDLSEGKIRPCMDEETKISFKDLERITNGRDKLSDILGIQEEQSEDDSFDDEEDELNTPLFDENDQEPFGSDDFPSSEFGEDEFDENIPDESELEGEFDNEYDGADVQDVPVEQDTYVPETPFEETTSESISQTAMRTFMIDEIAIDVSDQPFNTQFNASDLVLFTEKRPTNEGDDICNHLNECLNNMSKTANAEIRQSRTAHLNELRTIYMNSLGEFVRTCINSELSTFGDTASARARADIEAHHQEMIAQIENEVNIRKDRIDSEYNQAIENVRAAAAEAAEHEYRENHQKQYIAQIDAIRNTVEQEVENQYINDISNQNADRHKRALEMLDDAINTILEQLTVRYADMMIDERAIYQKHMESMLEFMSHQRYNEMNRIRVLQDEHARVDIAEKMSAKHAADVANITAKFNAQKKALEADIESMRKNIDVAVNRATADAERTIANLRADNQKLVEEAERARNKLDSADERAEAKYVNEIESLNNQISRWEDEAKKLHNGQKTSIFIMLGLSIAAVIAALAIGYISGQSHQAKQYTNAVQLESQMQQQNATNDTPNQIPENDTPVDLPSDIDGSNIDTTQTNESDADFSSSVE